MNNDNITINVKGTTTMIETIIIRNIFLFYSTGGLARPLSERCFA